MLVGASVLGPLPIADAQATDGLVWLDSAATTVEPGASEQLVLVNLTAEERSATVEVVGGAGVEVVSAPQPVVVAPGDRATVTVTVAADARPGTTGSIVAWGPGTYAVAPWSVPDVEVPSLPPLELRHDLGSIRDRSTTVRHRLPTGIDATGPPCPAAGDEGSLVGWLGGPGGQTASACVEGTSLVVHDLGAPGSWTGQLDLGGEEGVALTVDARDNWLLPLGVLLVGLAVAQALPIARSVRRPRLVLRNRTAGRIVAVREAHDSAVQRLGSIPHVRLDGIDVLSDERDRCYVDIEAKALLQAYAEALTGEESAACLPPSGTRWAAFDTLVSDVEKHYRWLVTTADRASGTVGEVAQAYPELTEEIDRAPLLGEALHWQPRLVETEEDWGEIKSSAEGRYKRVQRIGTSWRRIAALTQGHPALVVSLLRAQSDGQLDQLEAAIDQAESARRILDLEPATAAGEPEPDDRWTTKLWRFLETARWTVFSGAFGIFLLAPDLREKFAWGVLLLLALAVTVWVGRVAARNSSPKDIVARTRRQIGRMDVAVMLTGGIIVVATGFTTLYLQDTTFGGLPDYFAIGTWGFTVGTGVNLARRLLPDPDAE